ncbi:hypothetical protein A45J_2151 [hot springs metagenome]|uniref:Uncharacterized protein n=1 Tax=hot springs metagenome TaxID=433727 RepID=A0A5J4L667_9ZZZZ
MAAVSINPGINASTWGGRKNLVLITKLRSSSACPPWPLFSKHTCSLIN